jgi:hypothetical protein
VQIQRQCFETGKGHVVWDEREGEGGR